MRTECSNRRVKWFTQMAHIALKNIQKHITKNNEEYTQKHRNRRV